MEIVHKHKESPKQMFNSFKTLLLDPAGVMGLGGALILTITSLIQGMPAVLSAIGGIVLVGVSAWQKVQVTKRQNAAELRRQQIYERKQRVLTAVENKQMSLEIADFTLKHLDNED